jgi:hypothetical protein
MKNKMETRELLYNLYFHYQNKVVKCRNEISIIRKQKDQLNTDDRRHQLDVEIACYHDFMGDLTKKFNLSFSK